MSDPAESRDVARSGEQLRVVLEQRQRSLEARRLHQLRMVYTIASVCAASLCMLFAVVFGLLGNTTLAVAFLTAPGVVALLGRATKKGK